VKPKRVFASEEERQAARQATKRLYVLRHPERVRAAKRACMERDPARLKAWLTNAKARRKRAQGDVTGREWKAIVFFYGHRCGQCATHADIKPLTVDHFIPLIHGGTNTWRNVWPLSLDCNLRKGTSMPSATAPPHVEPMLRTGTYA
jgi:5-methylcytosine-specific restriction endonuclease McrA